MADVNKNININVTTTSDDGLDTSIQSVKELKSILSDLNSEYDDLRLKKELNGQLTDEEAEHYQFLEKEILKYSQVAERSTTRVTQATNLHSRATTENTRHVLENGGAMGILGAATGGMAMDIKDAIEAFGISTDKLKTLKGAAMAAGIAIGAVVVLELIQNWDKWVGVIDGSTKALERMKNQLNNVQIANEQLALSNKLSNDLASAYALSETERHKITMTNIEKEIEGKLKQRDAIKDIQKTILEATIPDMAEYAKQQAEIIKIDNEVQSLRDSKLVASASLRTSLRNKEIEDEKTKADKLKEIEKGRYEDLIKFLEDSKKKVSESEAKIKENALGVVDDSKYGQAYAELKKLMDIRRRDELEYNNILAEQEKIQRRLGNIKPVKTTAEEGKTLELQSKYNKLLEDNNRIIKVTKELNDELTKTNIKKQLLKDELKEIETLYDKKKAVSDKGSFVPSLSLSKLDKEINELKISRNKLLADITTIDKVITDNETQLKNANRLKADNEKQLEINKSETNKLEKDIEAKAKANLSNGKERILLQKQLNDNQDKLNNLLDTTANTSKQIADKEAELLKEKTQNQNKINQLKDEETKINNKILDFEKGYSDENGKYLDERLNNSEKFIDLNKKVNEQLKSRIETFRELSRVENLDNTKKVTELTTEEEKLKNLLTLVTSYKEQGKTIQDVNSAGIGVPGIDNQEQKDFASIQSQNAINAGLNLLQFEKDLNLKLQGIQQERTTSQNEINKVNSVTEINIASETAAAKLQIELNSMEQKRMMRDEELQRERMYYDAVLNIANESSGLLDALISNGHLKGKKDAENALALRKAAGVASVIISGQEEIRGIWANPALTALPDAGFSTKAALTGASVIKHGLSIGKIVAQKLNGGSSNPSDTGGGASPQASFTNVQASATNQLAATIGAQQQKPIKAYVVGSDIKTADALDRNISSNSTFI